MEYLKNKNWTFDKLSNFIFKIGLIMVTIYYYEDLGDEITNLNEEEDYSLEEFEIVKSYKENLEKYFPKINYDELEK